jgi:cardiolipin synthase
VFVGSENFSAASLDENRELGIRTANAAVLSAISATIASDYAHA